MMHGRILTNPAPIEHLSQTRAVFREGRESISHVVAAER